MPFARSCLLRLAAGCAAAAACALALAGAAAGEPYAPKPLAELLPQGVPYDPAVPTPEEVTGHATGEIVLPYELLTAYVRAVDAASDRVSVEEIGRSHLGRPILAVTITSERNQGRLEAIRAAQQSVLAPDAPPVADDQPVVIQIMHGVHGAETSGYDVAPLLLYHLAAAEDAETRAAREAAVITLVVTLNPDGGARMATWVNAHHANVPVSHPDHRERGPFFLWGRGNHYWFDLNRQWLPVTQPEAVAVVERTQDWLPHVVADLHEMGEDTSYFVGPGPRTGLHPLLTEESFELARAVAAEVAAEADAEGRLYVSEENFDDYYLGYGSSYPGLLGGAPLLFEQSATRGLVYDGADGLQRYDDKIVEHFRSVLALIRGSVAHRAEFLDYQRRYFADMPARAAADDVKAYVFASSDHGRLRKFLELLETHRIEVAALARDVEAGGRRFRAGEAFIAPLDQPRYAVLRGLFETRIPDGKTEFYDISGWTAPLAFGLEHAELGAGAFRRDLVGPPASLESVRRAVEPDLTSYAYVMEWNARYAPRAAYRALEAGLRAKVLPAPARVRTAAGDVDVARGAIVFPAADQPLDAAAIHALMVRAAREDDVTVHAAVSGLTPAGPDLGGFGLAPIETPRVLLVTGRGVVSEDAGEVWHLLDHEMAMPVVMIDQAEIRSTVLYDFTHVVMVDGAYDRLPDGFGPALEAWMRRGGVLVALRGAARWAMHEGLSSAMPIEPDDEGFGTLQTAGGLGRSSYADRGKVEAENQIGGAVFAIGLDPTHPLGYGYDSGSSHVHRVGVHAFASRADQRFSSVAWYAEDPLASGYASEANRERLAGATAVFAERRGEGASVLFADDPVFRAYWLASERMFLNTLFFARAIAPKGSTSYH